MQLYRVRHLVLLTPWWAEEIVQGFKKSEETVYIAQKWKPPSLKDDRQTIDFSSASTSTDFCSFEYENDTKLYLSRNID